MTELTREYLLNIKNLFQECPLAKMCDLALKGLEAGKLTEQRNALLAALKKLTDGLVLLPNTLEKHFSNNFKQAHATIAAVEG